MLCEPLHRLPCRFCRSSAGAVTLISLQKVRCVLPEPSSIAQLVKSHRNSPHWFNNKSGNKTVAGIPEHCPLVGCCSLLGGGSDTAFSAVTNLCSPLTIFRHKYIQQPLCLWQALPAAILTEAASCGHFVRRICPCLCTMMETVSSRSGFHLLCCRHAAVCLSLPGSTF